MKRTALFVLTLFAALSVFAKERSYSIVSPSGKIETQVNVGSIVDYEIRYDGRTVLAPSAVSMTLSDGRIWGVDAKVAKVSRGSVDSMADSPLYRASKLRERYNSLIVSFKGGWSLEFRVYDDAVAYRFATVLDQPFRVGREQVSYNFPQDWTVTLPYVKKGVDGDFGSQFFHSFENLYTVAPISALNPGRLAFLPLMVDAGEGVKLCITDVNLNDYPGMYLHKGEAQNSLEAVFAPCPKTVVDGGYNNIQGKVVEYENFLVSVDAPRTFPWRACVIGTDTRVAQSDAVWLLAEPSEIEDVSWIKPGKVAWDWWNNWNIYGVDFKSGINTRTYKYYIDFASANGIEYVILDDGWAVGKGEDLLKINPEIDMQGIVDYAASKNVGIILWAGYAAFERDMENVCRHYSEMGVKGFKVDFMDRDDCLMTAFNYRAAQTAAKYGLVLDLHGTHKPAGINRTWPNVLNTEGVHGLENMKWSSPEVDQMKYDVILPFVRSVAGPMDYTQGAMLNASRDSYRPNNSEPMSQGTRCHQLALYMVFDSPLNMLCDSPSNYMREKECTDFIAGVPVVWDETRVLAGEVGEYIVTARRSGDDWYIGAITCWTPRDLEIDLSFLGKDCRAVIFTDGANAHRKGIDYRREEKTLDTSVPFSFHLAPGGGFVLKTL